MTTVNQSGFQAAPGVDDQASGSTTRLAWPDAAWKYATELKACQVNKKRTQNGFPSLRSVKPDRLLAGFDPEQAGVAQDEQAGFCRSA